MLLADLGLPDGSGIDLIGRATEQGSILSLVVTVFGDEDHVVAAIRAGAMGYLLKGLPETRVAEAVSEVLAGGSQTCATARMRSAARCTSDRSRVRPG